MSLYIFLGFIAFIAIASSKKPQTKSSNNHANQLAPTAYHAQSMSHLEGVGTMATQITNNASFGKFQGLDGTIVNWSIEKK